MAKALPQAKRRNAPWTPLQRLTWLAEHRRKERLLPAPVLRAAYPDKLAWDWKLLNPYKWIVWMSLDGGASYILIEDYWMYGDARQFAPDGGGELYYIVGVDTDGKEITRHSNVIRPDDAPPPSLLLTDLLAYWTLDESGGYFLDASGNGNTAYDAGFDPITRGAAGKINSGASCEDFGQYLNAPIGSMAGNFSISFWLKSSTTNYYTCMCQSDVGYMGWLLSVAPAEPTYGINFNIYTGDPENGGGGGFSVTAPEVIDDAWHHIVCVKNGYDILIFKDGVLADATSGDFDIVPATSDLMFFDNSTALGQTFVGTLDEVGIWQRALTVAEVGQLYNGGSGLAFNSF
jgi:hypothetical protein